jgi:O-antigen/teichoic acid export membrane protein
LFNSVWPLLSSLVHCNSGPVRLGITSKMKNLRHLLTRKGDFLFDLLATSSANALIMLCGLVTGVLTARLLGPAGRGDFAIIQMYGTLAGAFCASGLSASIIYLSNNDRRKIPAILGGAAIAGTLIGLVAMFSALLIIVIALSNKSIEVRTGAVIYLFYIPLAICASLFWASLQAGLEIRAWNKTRVLCTALWLIPIFVIWMFFEISAKRLAMAYLCFFATTVGYFVLIAVRRYGKELLLFKYDTAKQIAKYAMPTSFASIFNQSNLRLDLILISTIGSSAEMGFYVIALAYSSLQFAFLASVSQLSLPKISSISAYEERLEMSVRLSRMAILASVVVALIVSMLSSILIPLLFGENFKGAVSVSIILSGAAAVAFASAVLSDCLRGFGLPQRPLIAEAVSSIAIAILLLPLYWQFGLHGVALVIVLGSIVSFSCLSWYMAQELDVSYSRFLLLKKDDIEYVVGRFRNLRQYP